MRPKINAMKKYYITLILLNFLLFINSQNVNIPDENFKNYLLNYSPAIDTNNDGEIQVLEAEVVTDLSIVNPEGIINSLEGLESFINLTDLGFYNVSFANNITIENLLQLDFLRIEFSDYNSLNIIDLSSLLTLELLFNSNENFTTFDISSCNCEQLESIWFDELPYLTALDGSDLINLMELTIRNMPSITELNISNSHNLEIVSIYDSGNIQTDFSQNFGLRHILIWDTQINHVDLTNSPNLLSVDIISNEVVQELDLSQNSNLNSVFIEHLSQLEILNLKNGTHDDVVNGVFEILPSLNYICADEEDLEILEAINYYGDADPPTINTYCSFGPGGEVFVINGQNKIDVNDDGCDSSDALYPNLEFQLENDSFSETYFSGNSGDYVILIQEGEHTITPSIENQDYFNISPESVVVNFPDDGDSFLQDFCIVPNGTHNDLEITVISLEGAIPGFDAEYRIFYKNKGNQVLSGDLQFLYNDDVMNFESASQTVDVQNVGSLLWNYTYLVPFETRTIDVTMLLNTPTDSEFPLNGDDILTFESVISPSDADETPEDNVFVLDQTVVNSFDPNDKICLQGDEITEDQVGEYVHYRIRFENTGTANAVNIVVKDDIDETKYDITSLVPLHASHNYVTRINDHTVEFIFENIQLPFDDANNDGYVFFKIKTLPSLQIGDSFDNDAEIYFDFNFPIITEDAITTVVSEELSIETFEVNNLKIYPNPVSDVLHIVTEQRIESLTIYDLNGRLLQRIVSTGLNLTPSVDVSSLSQGTYFVSVKTKVATQNYKFVKQ